MVTTVSGEQPSWVPMSAPVPPEHVQSRAWQRDVAILGAFAAMDMDHAASAIDITDLQVESFLHSQPQRIDGPEIDRHPLGVGRLDDLQHLLSRDDLWQRLNVLKLHLLEGLPVAFAGSGVEESRGMLKLTLFCVSPCVTQVGIFFAFF